MADVMRRRSEELLVVMDIQKFGSEVEKKLTEFDEMYSRSELEGLAKAISGRGVSGGVSVGGAAHYGENQPTPPPIVEEAKNVLKSSGVKAQICAALKTGANDVFDVGKLLVSVLVPLSLAGTITVPLTPIVVAAIAISISRMGISSFCANVQDK